jgi:lysophospholipid acyltransferase (LPLAT)-like uncharacterized protein
MERQSSRIHDDLLSFKPLSKYTFSQRIMIRGIDLGLYSVISAIGRTVRFGKIEGWKGLDLEGFETFEEAFARMPPSINAFWHNRLFLMTWFWREFESGIVVSDSFDGEYIARTAQRFGFAVIRGSSTRGGSKALKQMVRATREGLRMSLTVDGPKGPRYRVKSGIIMLAAKTGVPIVPMLPEAKSFWTVSSWDRLQIPRPFTMAKMFVGEPVFVSEADAEHRLKEKRDELQAGLDRLVEKGEQWRLGG